MSFRTTALLARKSVRARLGRTIAIAFTVTAGVSFVVGSFVLADSLRATFGGLFEELVSQVDLEVRSAEAFEGDSGRDPIDAAIADDIAAIDGVDVVEPALSRFAQLIDADGEIVRTTGGPALGFSYIGDAGLQGVSLKEGRSPNGPDELVVDKATADRVGYDLSRRFGEPWHGVPIKRHLHRAEPLLRGWDHRGSKAGEPLVLTGPVSLPHRDLQGSAAAR